MTRLLLVATLFLSSAAWADVAPPGGGCDCSSASGVPLALLGGLALWAARRK